MSQLKVLGLRTGQGRGLGGGLHGETTSWAHLFTSKASVSFWSQSKRSSKQAVFQRLPELPMLELDPTWTKRLWRYATSAPVDAIAWTRDTREFLTLPGVWREGSLSRRAKERTNERTLPRARAGERPFREREVRRFRAFPRGDVGREGLDVRPGHDDPVEAVGHAERREGSVDERRARHGRRQRRVQPVAGDPVVLEEDEVLEVPRAREPHRRDHVPRPGQEQGESLCLTLSHLLYLHSDGIPTRLRCFPAHHMSETGSEVISPLEV